MHKGVLKLETNLLLAIGQRIIDLNEEWIKRYSLQKGVLKPETTWFFWFLHEEHVAVKDSSLVSVDLRREKRFWIKFISDHDI